MQALVGRVLVELEFTQEEEEEVLVAKLGYQLIVMAQLLRLQVLEAMDTHHPLQVYV